MNTPTDKSVDPRSSQPAGTHGAGQSKFLDIKSFRLQMIATADDTITLSEPSSPTHSKYPFNNVEQTESGHVFEVDDTPGAERLFTMHKSGTFTEIHPDGTRVQKIFGDDYYIALIDHTLFVGGNLYISVQGNANLLTSGNLKMKVGGDMETIVKGNYTTRVDGNSLFYSKGDINFQTEGSWKSLSNGDAQFRANGNCTVYSAKAATVYGKSSSEVYSDGDTTFRSNGSFTLQSDGQANIYGKSGATIWSDGTAYFNGTAARANSAPMGAGGATTGKPAVKSGKPTTPNIKFDTIGTGINLPDSIVKPSVETQFILKNDNMKLIDSIDSSTTYPNDR